MSTFAYKALDGKKSFVLRGGYSLAYFRTSLHQRLHNNPVHTKRISVGFRRTIVGFGQHLLELQGHRLQFREQAFILLAGQTGQQPVLAWDARAFG